MKRLKTAMTIAMAMTLASCGVAEVYVQADSDTFDAIAPEYTSYVLRDHTLDQKDKEIRLRTVRIWEERIEAASSVVRK